MSHPGDSQPYVLRAVDRVDVVALCEQFHGYGGASNTATYSFGVVEDGRVVAGFLWQPPPPGAAKAVCPEFPAGVLALSRMVAVPRSERRLNHVSRPLRRQMKHLIDRSRWPVLITYSDEGQGHSGHVYRCSGWKRTARSTRPTFIDSEGRRVSSYRAGEHVKAERDGSTIIQRWEHWACERGDAWAHAEREGWFRVQDGRWRSGRPRFSYTRHPQARLFP